MIPEANAGHQLRIVGASSQLDCSRLGKMLRMESRAGNLCREKRNHGRPVRKLRRAEDQHVGKPLKEHAAHVAMDPRILRRCFSCSAGGGMDCFQEIRA